LGWQASGYGDQIPWRQVDARGAQPAVVGGDPGKPSFCMGLQQLDRRQSLSAARTSTPTTAPS